MLKTVSEFYKMCSPPLLSVSVFNRKRSIFFSFNLSRNITLEENLLVTERVESSKSSKAPC